jgi:hypothetical protein
MRAQSRLTLVFALVVASSAAASANGSCPRLDVGRIVDPFVPMVSMQGDRRQGADSSALGVRFGATGIVRCGGATGTAQLVMRSDVIITAAHVLIGPGGSPRASCTFRSNAAAGSPVSIEMASLKSGSTNPLSEAAIRDWAVARLSAPVAGATPYGLAAPGANPASVFLSAAGNGAADRMGIERCSARPLTATASDGIREIAIDCSTGPGASGGALLDAGRRVVAIYVGYRSTNPEQTLPFSTRHYNFAISVDGSFRRALLAAAGR